MSIRYYDRLNRFGIDFDREYGELLIFPEEYCADFIDRFMFMPFQFRRFSMTFMFPATTFLHAIYNINKEAEKSLGNMLYPSGIEFLVDFVLGPDDQNMIELLVCEKDHLSSGIQTVYGRQKPNGSTKEEIIENVLRHIKLALENKINDFNSNKLIAERFTSKPVESNNWKSSFDA